MSLAFMCQYLIFFNLLVCTECLRRSGRLSVSRRSTYRKTLDCLVRITAPTDHRFVIVFTDLDVEWEPLCDDDFIQFFDGTSMKSPVVNGLPPRVCGHKIPRGNYVTTQNALTVYFRSDIYKEEDGFEIVFTSFHRGPLCDRDELRCDNGRCVAASLKCNDFDNCGDNSDECDIDASTLVGIVSSVFLLSVLAIGSARFCQNRSRTRRETKRKASMAKSTIAAPVVKFIPKAVSHCALCHAQPAPSTSDKYDASRTQKNAHALGEDTFGQDGVSIMEKSAHGLGEDISGQGGTGRTGKNAHLLGDDTSGQDGASITEKNAHAFGEDNHGMCFVDEVEMKGQ